VYCAKAPSKNFFLILPLVGEVPKAKGVVERAGGEV